MSSKNLSFLAYCWFISVAICLIIEGSYFGENQNSIINELSVLTTLNIGDITIPVFNTGFAHGVMRLLTWDYSFYQGGYTVLRWFWMAVLSPGAVWGIGSTLAYIIASFVGRF